MPYRSRRRTRGGRFRFRLPLKKMLRWGSKANRFLKKNKVLSTLGAVYGNSGMRGSNAIKQGAPIASQFGYGRRRVRRRRRRGGALRAAGGMCR